MWCHNCDVDMLEISNPNWDLLDQLVMGANQRVQVLWEALEIKEFFIKRQSQLGHNVIVTCFNPLLMALAPMTMS